MAQSNKVFGEDYFDELLERIREIRASERRFYQKITDIYALSVDYDKEAPITKDFFLQCKIIGNLEQSVFGEPAYPSIESKAAHLLYFVVKNPLEPLK